MSLLELALSVPWLMEPSALEAMLSIAAREPLPRDEIARRMHGPKNVTLRDGQKRDDSAQLTTRDGVGIIPIVGPIYRYADMFTEVSGGATTESIARDLQKALDDPQITAVMLMIDSPGGEGTGINELADAIYAGRAKKPIVAYVESFGASAAYWLASAASEVVVDPTAMLGSIGTVIGMWDPDQVPTKRIEFVSKQSPKKRPDPRTEAGKAVLQQLVDDLTEVFIGAVMRNRSLTYEQVTALEGGLVVGQQAIDAGLADRLGSEEQVVRDLAARPRGVQRLAGPTAKGDTMKLKDMWQGFFQAAKEEGIPIETEDAPGQLQPRTLAPGEVLAEGVIDPQVAELRAQVAKLQAERITQAADAFVKGELAAGRAYPAETAALTALYIRAAEADAAHPPDAGTSGHVALLTAALAARPATPVTRQLLPHTARLLPPQPPSDETASIEDAKASATTYAQQVNGARKR